jgi:hypothetical protein
MQATAIFFAVYKIVSEILISLLRQKNAKGLIVQQRNKRRLGRTTNYPLEQLENFLKNLKPRLMRCTWQPSYGSSRNLPPPTKERLRDEP